MHAFSNRLLEAGLELTNMNSVRLHRKSNINAIINNERDSVFVTEEFRSQCNVKKLEEILTAAQQKVAINILHQYRCLSLESARQLHHLEETMNSG